MNWQIRTDGAPAGSGILRSYDGVPDLRQSAVFRHDAAIDTNILALQLEEMETEVFKADYPDVKTAQIIPLRDDGDPGSETYSFANSDGNAEWGLLGEDGRPNDAPSQSMSRSKDKVSYYSFAHAFGYTINDIRRASKANVPLSTEQPLLARESWEETFESIVANGFAGTDLRPLLAYPGVASEDATGAYEDITDGPTLVNVLMAAFSKRMEEVDGIDGLLPNRWIFPLSIYRHLLDVPYVLGDSAIDVGKSPLEVFVAKVRKIVPDFDVTWWRKCKNAEPGGVRHRSLLYKLDPKVVFAKSSVSFEMLPVQADGYGFRVPCHTRTAGVVVRKPLGLKYIDIPVAT